MEFPQGLDMKRKSARSVLRNRVMKAGKLAITIHSQNHNLNEIPARVLNEEESDRTGQGRRLMIRLAIILSAQRSGLKAEFAQAYS